MEDHPLSAVRDCLFNIFAVTLHIWRPFFHPQPEDAPCRGDRDPLITWLSVIVICIIKYSFRHQDWINDFFDDYEFNGCRHFQNLIEQNSASL